MPVLDFKEIPEAHLAGGKQDSFELFARDFLDHIGYKILAGPDRGADGGKDILVEEIRTGVGGQTTIRWLVSCKHKVFSGKSVTPDDDSNISDRLASNDCKGFIGFYSTVPSAGLAKIVHDSKWDSQIFDHEKIERQLLHSSRGIELADRYFPISMKNWKVENPTPSRIFTEAPEILCKICNKNLLEMEDKGIVTLWEKMGELGSPRPEHYLCVFWTCRGHCDHILRERLRRDTLVDGWEDISDVAIPIIFIKWVMTIINGLRSGTTYSDEAFESIKDFLLHVFPYVARHPTKAEEQRIKDLTQVPHYLGGLGYPD